MYNRWRESGSVGGNKIRKNRFERVSPGKEIKLTRVIEEIYVKKKEVAKCDK